jgi:hypothetical protein
MSTPTSLEKMQVGVGFMPGPGFAHNLTRAGVATILQEPSCSEIKESDKDRLKGHGRCLSKLPMERRRSAACLDLNLG